MCGRTYIFATPCYPSVGNATIEKLDLGQNGIGDRGAASLAEALKLNTTLQRLDLSGNAVDFEGASGCLVGGVTEDWGRLLQRSSG